QGDQNTGEKPGEDNPGEVCGVVGAPSCGNGSEIDTDVKPVCPAGETLNQQECGGPIEAAGVVEYIYQVVNGTVDTSIDYVTADVNPQVGNEYILSVFDTEKNKDITETYSKFTWGVTGTNETAATNDPSKVTVLD